MPSSAASSPSSRRSVSLLLAAGVLAATAAQVATPGTAEAATTVSTTSLAVADVAVREDQPTTKLGTATTLRTDGSPFAQSYLRFQVGGHAGAISKAVLQVYSHTTSDAGVVARPVASTWSETGTTWATRPTVGAIVAKSGPTQEATWASLDVTSLVKTNGTVDIALTSTSTTGRSLASREAGATRAARLVVTSLPAISTVTVPTTPAVPPLLITPGGAGTRDGSSWSNAGDLVDLPRFVAQRPTGGEIWVRGDAGPYRPASSIGLRTGGAAGAPVVVRGVDGTGASTARPVIVGTRTAPYSSTGNDGNDIFKLYTGAKNLTFSNLSFTNVGTAFNVGGNAQDIAVQDVNATNVRRFFTNYLGAGETTANLSGLTMRRVTVKGFSKSVLRLANDSHRVLLEDVTGDSERQDGDDFAMGVVLDGTAHDVVMRRVVMRNAHDSLHAYMNGDGFATERGVYDVRLEDTLATGNTDAGYDLKSTRTTLVNARAEDNKRNFRFWAADTTVQGCTGLAPRTRGGSGSQAQVWAGANAGVTLSGCTLQDASAATIVFDLDTGARVTTTGTVLSHSSSAQLKRLASGAALQLG